MATLVGAHGHALDVLADRGPDHLVHRPVVAEVDDLGPLGLQEPPHDVDGGVVPVEQAGRGDEPDRVDRCVQRGHDLIRRGDCSGGVAVIPMRRDYYNVLLNGEGAVHLACRRRSGRPRQRPLTIQVAERTFWPETWRGVVCRRFDEQPGRLRRAVWLVRGQTLVGLHQFPDPADDLPFNERRVGLDHLAFACSSRAELEAWEVRLNGLGIANGGVVDASYGSGLSCRDPDNIALEFFAPPP